MQDYTVGEAQRVVNGINIRDDESLVLIEALGQVVQIVFLSHLPQHAFDGRVLADLDFETRFRQLGRGDENRFKV